MSEVQGWWLTRSEFRGVVSRGPHFYSDSHARYRTINLFLIAITNFPVPIFVTTLGLRLPFSVSSEILQSKQEFFSSPLE